MWSESNFRVRDAVSAARKEVIDSIKEKCNFMVDSSTPIGGNTNSGPVSEKFFSPRNRDKICCVILRSSDREKLSTVLGYFNKVVTVIQNLDPSKIVNSLMFKQLC